MLHSEVILKIEIYGERGRANYSDVVSSMKLYLMRHGETVDNVAGLYAGTQDSTLTNYGVEQTKRLGDSFAKNDVKFTHIFSSPLSRAFKTAQALLNAEYQHSHRKEDTLSDALAITQVQELIERDFGFYEGKPFSTRRDAKDSEVEKYKKQPGFVDVESEESMATRIDAFLDHHLLPLLEEDGKPQERVVAVVAHGMLLSHFWRRLLLRLPRRSLTIAPEITAARGDVILEHLGGWSNTGYLELCLRRDGDSQSSPAPLADMPEQKSAALNTDTLPTPVPPPLKPEDAEVSVGTVQREELIPTSKKNFRSLMGWSTTILAIDSKVHLVGLKRQRGGIGSLAHDESQKKLDSFFKRPRLT